MQAGRLHPGGNKKIPHSSRIPEKIVPRRGFRCVVRKHFGKHAMPLDAAELATLIERHAISLQLWVRSRSSSGEDVVQEAFCRLAMQEPPPRNPVAWLYRVSRNLAEKQRITDQRRRHREQVRARIAADSHESSDPVELSELLAAVDGLETDLREVLIARVWGQLSLEEVGNLCGISTATAFRRYETALEALRVKLEAKCENRA